MNQAQAIKEPEDIRIDAATSTPPVVTTRLKGRFMLPDRSEHECVATRFDVESVYLQAEVKPEEGTVLVVYLTDVGRLEGHVTHDVRDTTREDAASDVLDNPKDTDSENAGKERDDSNADPESTDHHQFRLVLKMTAKRREKMIQTLEWLKAKAEGRAQERRRHLRIEPQDGQSRIVLSDGRSYPCEVLDISLSGASVRMAVLPAIGTHVTLGRMRGRVVRHHESGIAIEFVQTARPEALQQTVRKL